MSLKINILRGRLLRNLKDKEDPLNTNQITFLK